VNEQFKKAGQLVTRSKYAEALKLYRKALKKAEGEDEITCHMALGDTYRMTGDFISASEHYEVVVAVAPNPLKSDALVGLGLSRRALGYWKDSIKLIDKASKYYIKSDDAEGVAFTTWAMAGALRIKGDIPAALKGFKESHKLYKKMKNEAAVGYSLCGMGGTSRIIGKPADSLKFYTQANELFAARKDVFGTAYSHCGMGNALRMQEDFEGAREHFTRASVLYRRIGDIVSFAYTLWSMGKAHMNSGSSVMAEKYFKDARSLFRKTHDPRGLVYIRMAMAELSAMHGKKHYARKLADESLAEAKEWGFDVELAHARVLVSALEGDIDNSAYKEIGLKLKYNGLPLNIP
jgi:tetratricopeptide (TPR) repeat protein